MNALAERLYPRLPAWGRSPVASVRGMQLRMHRHGRGLERQVAEAHERDYWDPQMWEAATERALGSVLKAARAAPYYREIVPPGRSAPGGNLSLLSEVAVTPKAAVRGDPTAFWSALPVAGKVVSDTTSGTTGTPLTLLTTRDAVRAWYALYEARIRQWHGVKLHDRWAMFGGQVVVPMTSQEPPFWVHNWSMHQLYVSTHHLGARSAAPIAAELRRFAPKVVLGYPSSIALFARLCLEHDVRLPQPEVVISNAETISPRQRDVITEAFGCPVRSNYGMAEMVTGASECEAGTMHLWPEAGIVEVRGDDGSVSRRPGDRGNLVLTGLLNTVMPMLRYEIGDRAGVPSPSGCACGRTLPVLGDIEGRSADLLVTPDGRHVYWINPVFRDLPVAEAQVVQHSIAEVEVKVVAQSLWDRSDTDVLVERLGERLGSAMRVTVTMVDEVPRDPSGKFRPVVSEL